MHPSPGGFVLELRTPPLAQTLYRILAPRSVETDEWMYQLMETELLDDDGWASTFKQVVKAKSRDDARALLQAHLLRAPGDAFAQRLLDRMPLWTPHQGTVLREGPEEPEGAPRATPPGSRRSSVPAGGPGPSVAHAVRLLGSELTLGDEHHRSSTDHHRSSTDPFLPVAPGN